MGCPSDGNSAVPIPCDKADAAIFQSGLDCGQVVDGRRAPFGLEVLEGRQAQVRLLGELRLPPVQHATRRANGTLPHTDRDSGRGATLPANTGLVEASWIFASIAMAMRW